MSVGDELIEQIEEGEALLEFLNKYCDDHYGGDWTKFWLDQKQKTTNFMASAKERAELYDIHELKTIIKRMSDQSFCVKCKSRIGNEDFFEHVTEQDFPYQCFNFTCSHCAEAAGRNGLCMQWLIGYHLEQPSRKYYNYILLDESEHGTDVTYEDFRKSVFYVGKGNGGRYLDHFEEARNGQKSKKHDKIRESTVIVVQFNLQSCENLAFCIETCLMAYFAGIGQPLTNTAPGVKKGKMIEHVSKDLLSFIGNEAMLEAFSYFKIAGTRYRYKTQQLTQPANVNPQSNQSFEDVQ